MRAIDDCYRPPPPTSLLRRAPQDNGPPIDEQKTLVLVRRGCTQERPDGGQATRAPRPRNVELSEVAGARTQVNTFVIQTTAMLNQFAAVADRKLETVHRCGGAGPASFPFAKQSHAARAVLGAERQDVYAGGAGEYKRSISRCSCSRASSGGERKESHWQGCEPRGPRHAPADETLSFGSSNAAWRGWRCRRKHPGRLQRGQAMRRGRPHRHKRRRTRKAPGAPVGYARAHSTALRVEETVR